MGLNQISMFEAKIANGNGEQTLSRDIYRLGHRFDFFRMMSCYFTTVGFYFSTLVLCRSFLVKPSSVYSGSSGWLVQNSVSSGHRSEPKKVRFKKILPKFSVLRLVW